MDIKAKIPLIAFSAAGVVCLLFAFSSCERTKKMDSDFNERKAILIKENLDLKDKADSLDVLLKQKLAETSTVEERIKALKGELAALKKKYEQLSSDFAQLNNKHDSLVSEKESLSVKIEEVRKENASLQKDLSDYKKLPVEEKIKEALGKGSDVKVSSAVDLSKISVKKESGVTSSPVLKQLALPLEAEVVTVDPKNNLVIIELGRKDKIKAGDKCVILRDNQEIASGEVMSVQFKVSAVFINKLSYKRVITDIEIGDRALVSRG